MIDDLPSATVIRTEPTNTQKNPPVEYNEGIRVGWWNPMEKKADSGGLGVSSVNNHLKMTIEYHTD